MLCCGLGDPDWVYTLVEVYVRVFQTYMEVSSLVPCFLWDKIVWFISSCDSRAWVGLIGTEPVSFCCG